MLESADERRGVPAPTWIDIAPDLLQAGANLLEIEVAHDYRAGLSVLRLGPERALWRFHVRDDALQLTLPRSLNLFGIGLALFIISIWWRRRSERALGLFAALLALLSVRNVAYSSTGKVVHTPGTDVLFYLANVVAAMLLARFALAWAGRDWHVVPARDGRRWRRPDRGRHRLRAVRRGAADARADLSAGDGLARARAGPDGAGHPARGGCDAGRAGGQRRDALPRAAPRLLLHPRPDLGRRLLLDAVRGADRAGRVCMGPARPLRRRARGGGGPRGAARAQGGRATRASCELANTAKTRFLAAASHDLRQPAVSIGLLADLLREQPLPPATHHVLGRLGDSVQALNGLLKGLLDLSRFDAGAVQARLGRVALQPLLEAVVSDQREAARLKGIELRLRAPSVVVRSDALLLEQVLRNLVGNAVRYTERGGVLVAVRRRGEQVLLQVWDTGAGIATESQALVFEEFVQLDNPARARTQGIGLGLSLVKRAAAVMGAPLGLRSQPGRGSCFWIELPLAEAEPALAAPAPAAPALDLIGLKLWVVEDDPDVREALHLRLCGWGAHVRAFDGAAAAGDAIDAGSAAPDVLVTDQRLPDGSGLAVAQRLRDRFGRVPVLVVTGDTSPADVLQLRASGMSVMHKPFASDELLAAVRALAPARVVRA